MKKLLCVFAMAVTATAFAHEGPHGPEMKMGPNAGKLIASSNLTFEFLKDETGIKVYAYTHESLAGEKKPLSPSEVTIVTKKTTLTDSKKKNVEFKLEPENDHFKLTYKGTSSYFVLNLVASFKAKEEKPVKWQFEP